MFGARALPVPRLEMKKCKKIVHIGDHFGQLHAKRDVLRGGKWSPAAAGVAAGASVFDCGSKIDSVWHVVIVLNVAALVLDFVFHCHSRREWVPLLFYYHMIYKLSKLYHWDSYEKMKMPRCPT